jgi:hypothetical protein
MSEKDCSSPNLGAETMTFRALANKYLGWCPRLFLPLTSLIPIVRLQTSGKIGFVTMLLVWSFGSLFQGFIYLTQNSPGRLDLLGDPNIARSFFQTVMVFPFGLSLVILITDYLITGRVVKRHGLELIVTVIIGAIGRVALPLVDLVFWLQGGLSWTRLVLWVSWPPNMISAIIADSYILILLVLCGYLAKRVITNKNILSKWMFLLFAANYLWLGFEWLWTSLIQPSMDASLQTIFTRVWYEQAVIIFETSMNLVFAIFLLDIYLRLRQADQVEVSAPLYLRGFFLLYGLFGVFYRFISFSSVNMNEGYGLLLTVMGIIGDLAIVLVSVYPPQLAIITKGKEVRTRL